MDLPYSYTDTVKKLKTKPTKFWYSLLIQLIIFFLYTMLRVLAMARRVPQGKSLPPGLKIVFIFKKLKIWDICLREGPHIFIFVHYLQFIINAP